MREVRERFSRPSLAKGRAQEISMPSDHLQPSEDDNGAARANSLQRGGTPFLFALDWRGAEAHGMLTLMHVPSHHTWQFAKN